MPVDTVFDVDDGSTRLAACEHCGRCNQPEEHERRDWRVNPAWVSVVILLLTNLVLTAYGAGALSVRVSNVELQLHDLAQFVLAHIAK
jgi:hypothetical protein